MIELLGTPEAAPFAIALGIMLVIAFLEGVGLLFGVAISGVIDSVLPDIDLPDLEVDLPDFDVDLDVDMDAEVGVHAPDLDLPGEVADGFGPFSYFLSWLSFGRVPALVLLVAFLTAFGLAGLGVQAVTANLTGALLPSWLASIPALFIALPCTRYLGRGLATVMPKEQTEAVSTDRFIGKIAVVTRGRARRDLPAEAKLKDQHGQTHWIRVEPDLDDDVFGPGDAVLVISQTGSVYRVIANPAAALSPDA